MTTISQTDQQKESHADDMHIYLDGSPTADGCATEKQVEDRYHKLLLLQIICLAIMCILQIVCMTKLSFLNEQLREQKTDLVRYLNSSEISVMQHMENEILSLKYSMELQKNKTLPKSNALPATK